MASLAKIHPLSVPGSLFVDTTCIDCGTCFHLAPQIFDEANDDKSYVQCQPTSSYEWTQSKRALVSCPTNSIGVKGAPLEFKEAPLSLPFLISGNVSYCGYTARDSFGASSYLIERKEGNILIDSPRFHPTLVKEIMARGGVKTMILTHQDDVADHELWAKHFNCERIIHRDEVVKGTENVEKILDFSTPFILNNEITLVPTPGHTRGHIVILYQNKYLFTGDHIFYEHESMKLRASKNVCWYSWEQQISSTEKLLQYSFEWILPGHGGWGSYSQDRMKMEMLDLLERMKRQ